MSRLLVLIVILISLLTLLTEAQRQKGRRGKIVRKKGKGKKQINKDDNGKDKGSSVKSGKIMKQDACTIAGHPCMAGQECIVERYTGKERCVCVEHCPYFPDAEVCGSDMKTYTTGCHLYKHMCDNHRMIFPVSFGSCDKLHTVHLKVIPEMAEACHNSHTTFRCQHDDMMERISEWRMGDKTLTGEGEEEGKYVVDDNMLTIKSVMGSDQGNYTCVTVDKNGTVHTANATLKLTESPYAYIPSNHISCEHGDQVMIPCEHSDNSQVHWMKNGFEVDETNVDESGMLILPQTEFDASGTYKCVVTNFCGTASSRGCEVEVKERDLDRCDDSVELVEGCENRCDGMICAAKPELECHVSRCGECGYFWIDEKKRNTTCPTLQAPTIIMNQHVSLTSEGEDAIIPCEVEGYPTPTVTWKHENGSSIEDLKKHSIRGNTTLVIRQLKLGVDNGRYTCIAENSQGKTNSSLVVAILPRMTPMCPQSTDTEMTCEYDFCATAACPAYEGSSEKMTCINTVCNVCTYMFVDKFNRYVDCYSDPKVLKMMQKMNGGQGAWPATGSMNGGQGSMGSMGNLPGWPASGSTGSMGSMAGWPASGSMGSMGSMGNMAGWPATGSMGSMGNMAGWPASGSMGSMGNMAGWPASGSMGSMGSMAGWPASGSMGSMGNMAGWPATGSMGSMGNMAGWPASGSMGSMSGNSMGGNNMGGGMSAMDKNAWHFVPGWPGHMSQMKSSTSGKGASTKDQGTKDTDENKGHLNVFYSGKEEVKEEEEEVRVERVYNMGH